MKFSGRAAGAARAHQAVAENILLADDRGVGGLEAAFEAEHRERRPAVVGSFSASGQDGTGVRLCEPVVGEHMAHALARAFAPQRDDDALARRLQRLHVLGHGLEHVAAGLGALGREIAALPACRRRSTAPSPSGTANGVSRASAAASRRSRHSSSAR